MQVGKITFVFCIFLNIVVDLLCYFLLLFDDIQGNRCAGKRNLRKCMSEPPKEGREGGGGGSNKNSSLFIYFVY